MTIFTTFNDKMYLATGKELIKSVKKYLPNAKIVVYEELSEDIRREVASQVDELVSIKSLPSFRLVFNNNKDVITKDFGGNADKPVGDKFWIHRWFGWFRKVAMAHHAICETPEKRTGRLIFVDSDIRFKKGFNDYHLTSIADGKPIAFLKGDRNEVESGFISIDGDSPKPQKFYSYFINLFLSGDFRKHPRWDDIWLMTHVIKHCPSEWFHDFAEGSSAGDYTNSNGHKTGGQIMPFSELSECVEHDKGFHVRNGTITDEMIHFYVGTDGDANGKAEKALEYSIKKSSSMPYRIEWMDTARGGEHWQGWNKNKWYTKFSHFRFAIPEIHGFKGRAIYMDVDQIILKDPKELINLEIPEDKAWIALAPHRTDVVVFDCAKFKDIDGWPSLQQMKGNAEGANIGTYVNKIKEYWHPLPHRWCCNDGGIASDQANKFETEAYDPDTTCLLHYTQMDWQPWKPYPDKFNYPQHPHARAESLWWQMYAGALEEKDNNL